LHALRRRNCIGGVLYPKAPRQAFHECSNETCDELGHLFVQEGWAAEIDAPKRAEAVAPIAPGTTQLALLHTTNLH
jgi:hypothetical protein